MSLLDGEEFNIDEIVINQQINNSDNFINEKYAKGEIRIITEQARYPLDTIGNMLESGKYNLNPEYQRRKRWNAVQQSKLIESFIINVPIPPIFLYEVDYAQYEVMDGLQRLTAIDDFYKDKFELTGLEEWKELNGRKYSQLPKNIKEGIDRRYLSSIVLLNETAKDPKVAKNLKQMVFGRLNSGGDKLTPQETRNALYMGKFNSFCIELSQNDNFRKLWNYPLFKYQDGVLINEKELLDSESYRKMEDVEMVLRFFAYRHLSLLSKFRSQEDFLDEFLKQANRYDEQLCSKLKNIFDETVSLVYQIFRESAFYMPETSTQKKSTPTKTIYDPLMQVISKNIQNKTTLLEKREELLDLKYKEKDKLTYESKGKNVELFDGKYNSKNNIESRIAYFEDIYKDIL